jgi:carboxymethylenebutenolidase
VRQRTHCFAAECDQEAEPKRTDIQMHRIARILLGLAASLAIITGARAQAPEQQASAPHRVAQRVAFPSQDGKTTLVGYLFLPQNAAGRAPAVVMMHGRAGAYSSRANGVYDASTLSKRHQAWGELWASLGYVAVLVDGFGPRGYPGGFGRHSYDNRPAELNEVTVRPLDAYGALAWLRARADVDPARIGLQGWSNGGSATLATMATDPAPGITPPDGKGFVAALAFYPACGLKDQFESGYRPNGPVRVLMGRADEEVSPKRCEALVEGSRQQGGDITIRLYPGATHSFDDPSTKRQRVEANAAATEDAVERAVRFFRQKLGGRG